MGRLIDADALMAELHKTYLHDSDARTVIYQKIEEQPTVDAVEVVRCKDCKHFHYDIPYLIQGIPVLMHEICTFWGNGCKTSENEFCSHAERREDEAH